MPLTIVVAAMYIIMCLLLTWLAHYLSKRESRSMKHIDVTGGGAEAKQIQLAAESGAAV